MHRGGTGVTNRLTVHSAKPCGGADRVLEQIVHTRRVGTPRLGGKEKNSQTIDLYCFAIFGQKAYPKGSQTGRNNWISGPVEHVARFQTESEDRLGSIDVWSSVDHA